MWNYMCIRWFINWSDSTKMHGATTITFILIRSFIRSLPYDMFTASPKRVLQTVRPSAASFTLRSSSSFLRLLPRLPATYLLPSIFPSITCIRGQFLSKMWPIRLALVLFIVCTIFLSWLILRNTYSLLTRSARLISILPQHHISNLSIGGGSYVNGKKIILLL